MKEGVAVFQPADYSSESQPNVILRFDSSMGSFIFKVPNDDEENVESREEKVEPQGLATAIVESPKAEHTIKVIDINQTKTADGIFLTLQKVELSEKYTAAFLTVENKSIYGSEVIFLRGRIIQGKRQFGQSSEGPRYKYIKPAIPPGIEEQGAEKFEPIDQTQDKARFEFPVVDYGKKGYLFAFDVDINKEADVK